MPWFPSRGGGRGGLYVLGPASNRFDDAAARDAYAGEAANAAWLRRYAGDETQVVLVGAAGAPGPWYGVESVKDGRDVVWVGTSVLDDRVLHAWRASGGADADDDIDYSGTNRNATWSAAANATRVYVLYEEASAYHIAAYGLDGTAHSGEGIALGAAPGTGSSWQGVAATDSRIYALWRSQDGNSAGVVVYNGTARAASEDQSLTVENARDLTATATRFRVLSDSVPAVYAYDSAWAAQSSETLQLSHLEGTYAGVAEHGGELYVLVEDHSSDPARNGEVLVYDLPAGAAPVSAGRAIRTGLSVANAIAGAYEAGTVAWVQRPGAGVAGATGPRGLPGSDATVTTGAVETAIESADATEVAAILTALGVEAGARGDQTPAEIIAAFRAAGAQWDWATDVDDRPTIPSVTGLLDATEVQALIDAGGFQSAGEVGTAIQTALAAAVTGNTEVGIDVGYADGKFTFRVTAQGGGGAVPTHTRYAAVKETTGFVAADFTGGASSTTNTITTPTWASGSRYVAFAIPDDQPDLTSIVQQGGSFEQITAFARVAGTIDIGGTDYKVWRSNEASLPALSGATYVIS